MYKKIYNKKSLTVSETFKPKLIELYENDFKSILPEIKMSLKVSNGGSGNAEGKSDNA